MSLQHSVVATPQRKKRGADKVLNATVTFWFTVAVAGQWLFAYYVTAFYGGAALQGDLMKWNQVLPHGYTPGETMGNLAVAIHLLLAVIMMVGGPLQFIPQLRTRARSFHRWNGRLYIITAFVISFSGVYMVLSKGTVSGLIGDISVSINGILIMLFAALAWRTAVARKFDAHRRWVLRLFLVVNGVWFFRIGLMLWLFIHGGPVGFDPETFRGPFLIFLGFGQYVIPLIILELYLYVQNNSGALGRILMATGFGVLTILMGIGIFAATMGMWLPRI
ncbi:MULTISPECIES: DUF2306 domain-containing protein [Aquimarina]|uniref:DUF2306 domain-containing protein n=1 Tax=Aquimarina algiphila TaxID=2047982 RepID=A0A554VPI2_9FLAO|nr:MULTISPECIES: DUF2306 domain-containing protein [Aquimarina]TSE10373.1 DUF2306 domain-containing protein [Aquimarina algiphila]